MKKYLIVLLSVFLLAACTDKNDSKNESGETSSPSKEQVDSRETTDEKEDKIYNIGETAKITSDIYDFDYEVTVTDFQITDEVDGVSIFDYVRGLEKDDPTRFVVVDVTIKNISDEPYIPNEMFSANLSDVGKEAGFVSELEFSPELDEELEPGEEVKSQIVYTQQLDDVDAYWFKYEIMSEEETIFELPNPAK